MKKTCTIIVNYFGAERTGRCIASLVDQAVDTILLVDNSASVTESTRLAEIVNRVSSPDIHLQVNENNLGFGRAVNKAIRLDLEDSGGHAYYVLINNDAEASPGMVERLVSVLEQRNDVSLVAPLAVTGSGQTGYFWYSRICGSVSLRRTMSSFPFLTGCCLVIRKGLVEKTPLFDEDFFMYGEDVILSWKIQRQGDAILCMDDIRVYHEGTGSSSHGGFFYEYHTARGHILIALKTAEGFPELLLFLSGRVLYLTARALIRTWRHRNLSPVLALFSCWIPLKVRLN